MFDDYAGRQKLRELKEFAVVWGSIALAAICIKILYAFLKPLFVTAYDFLTSTSGAHIFTVIGVLSIGVGLFYFRKYARLTYGVLEVAFGIAWASSFVLHLDGPNPKSDFFALMAVLYLIVRGLDNCDEGLEMRRAAIRKSSVIPIDAAG
jgi:hypothetical protein